MNRRITWDEFHHKMNERFGKTFRYVDEFYFNVEKKIDFGEYHILEDREVFGYLQKLHKGNGELCVITDLCYRVVAWIEKLDLEAELWLKYMAGLH